MAYHHFTRDDRVFLAKLRMDGLSVRSCARILGFHPSSIYRELRRGKAETATGYSVTVARTRSELVRHKANQQHRKLMNTHAAKLLYLLRRYRSPEQAAHEIGVSHSTVYRWLWRLPKPTLCSLRPYLRHPRMRRRYGTKRRERACELAKKRWIDDRPEEVNNRSTFGHWGDTVRGKMHSGYLVTLVERKSGYVLVGYVKRANKESFRKEAERLLAPFPKHLKRSLTLDNGREMADFEELERHTTMSIYFAHPYHSWERGTNENFNGLLRQFFPKQMSFAHLAQKDIDHATKLLNTRPRKRHGYVSPMRLI